MITMAQRITSLRTERGISRPALSAALGLPKNAVEKFETGRQTPSQEQQAKIAAYFGKDITELFIPQEDKGLSDKTIMHYHRLLSACR